MNRIAAFIKKEAVLVAAMLLAGLSAFIVTPDRTYINYIDFRTLALLAALMTVTSGLSRMGVFGRIAEKMLSLCGSIRAVTLALVSLCFFGSMLITNDVALITFVPLAICTLDILGGEKRTQRIISTVAMQTVAANLGSMLTPIGNPQNLYLYGLSGMGAAQFIALMLPYAAASLMMLLIWVFAVKGGKEKTELPEKEDSGEKPLCAWKLVGWAVLFGVCLLTVAGRLHYLAALAIVAAGAALLDIRALGRIDYSLLLTFVGFFIFIGNMGRIPAFSELIGGIVSRNETITAVVCSQVMSNVPAALLLSGFTDNIPALIVGTDIGGLGTLIASMASLISYKQIASCAGVSKGKYMLLFTASNLVFLAVLLIINSAIM